MIELPPRAVFEQKFQPQGLVDAGEQVGGPGIEARTPAPRALVDVRVTGVLVLEGTVRGHSVARPAGRLVPGLAALRRTHALEVRRLTPTRPDMNVLALAAVVIAPGSGGPA